MKKLLFIILCLSFLYGCGIKYNEYSSEVDNVDIIRKIGGIEDIYIRKFNYEGHKYLKFNDNVIHDPNCECFNKKQP